MMPLLIALAAAQVTVPAPNPSPEGVVRAMFESFNQHDARSMEALYAHNARLTSSDFCEPRGKADVQRTYESLFRAFPDIHDTIETLISEGNVVAVRFVAVSRTGKMALTIHTFITVRNGLIASDDSLFDNGGRPCEP